MCPKIGDFTVLYNIIKKKRNIDKIIVEQNMNKADNAAISAEHQMESIGFCLYKQISSWEEIFWNLDISKVMSLFIYQFIEYINFDLRRTLEVKGQKMKCVCN